MSSTRMGPLPLNTLTPSASGAETLPGPNHSSCVVVGASVQSHLGGRRRSNWSKVARVCQFLCDEFPMQLALVVSEGISRYDDKKGITFYSEGDVMYYEGTGYWKEVDHRKWPWTNIV